MLGRWEGHSAKGATVAFLLGRYDGETLIADAGVLCPPGADPEDDDVAGRAAQVDPYLHGEGKTIWRTLERLEDGRLDPGQASWYSGKFDATGVLDDPIPTLARGSLGHRSGTITKIERLDLPCRVGAVKVHHVDATVRADGDYPLASIAAGTGHVRVSAGGAFVAVEASLVAPSTDPENPAPCLPFYATDPLETSGGGDAFGVVLDEPSLATPENKVAITGAFSGAGTILGGFAGEASVFDQVVCPVAQPFVAKAPKDPLRPRLHFK